MTIKTLKDKVYTRNIYGSRAMSDYIGLDFELRPNRSDGPKMNQTNFIYDTLFTFAICN